MLATHPDYERLRKGNGLFYDPFLQSHSRQNMWAGALGESGYGSWVDFSASETRAWWSEGIKNLIELGFDGIWDDNSEFFTRDDEIRCQNEFDHKREVECEGVVNMGLMGRIMGNEMMNKVRYV